MLAKNWGIFEDPMIILPLLHVLKYKTWCHIHTLELYAQVYLCNSGCEDKIPTLKEKFASVGNANASHLLI